jgi:hypothetical protein
MVATLKTTFDVTRPTINPKIANSAKNLLGKTLRIARMFSVGS